VKKRRRVDDKEKPRESMTSNEGEGRTIAIERDLKMPPTKYTNIVKVIQM
jgi:hypothetical protein